MTVTASLIVSFADNADGSATGTGHLSAEVDDREDGLNDGDTSFEPGDTAWFLVYASANVGYDTPVSSAGTIAAGSKSLLIEREEEFQFVDTDTITLAVPSESIESVLWIGRKLGDLTLDEDGFTVRASASGVAIARVRYSARADAWSLTSPASLPSGDGWDPLTDFPILVYIQGYEQEGD